LKTERACCGTETETEGRPELEVDGTRKGEADGKERKAGWVCEGATDRMHDGTYPERLDKIGRCDRGKSLHGMTGRRSPAMVDLQNFCYLLKTAFNCGISLFQVIN